MSSENTPSLTKPGTSFSTQRRVISIAIVVLVVAAAVVSLLFRLGRKKTDFNAPVVAYVLPVPSAYLISSGWLGTKSISVPVAMRPGKTMRLSEGSRVTVLDTSTGASTIAHDHLQPAPPQKLPTEVNFFVSPLHEIIAEAKSALTKTARPFVVTSPANVTRYLNPTLDWVARPGASYNVAVLDQADSMIPPRLAERVKPPIALSSLSTPQRRQLGADRNYTIVIEDADAPAIHCFARVLTATDATLQTTPPETPEECFLEAFQAMVKRPYRTGDAWLALSKLPADWAQSEPGIRVRMAVAMDLGHKEALEQAVADAEKLLNPTAKS
jgi:hypothetical protein